MIESQKVSYQDIKKTILRRIHNKFWAPGSLMPGEVELAVEFGCARATVNRAMRELAEDGMIDRKRKAGTRIKSAPSRQAKFAIPRIKEEIEAIGSVYRYALINHELLTAPDWILARMGLNEETQMIRLSCMHYAGSRAFQYEDRWINLKTVPKAKMQSFTKIGPNEWLIKEVPFSDAEVTFSTINADEKISRLLGVSSGTALFTVERLTWLNNAPITYAKLFFHAGYQITSRL
ncbi:MAG: GntR family transcriptional regulator [Rhodobacteraceae bacterium]|nr:GntR family transcriptional regulator [Paracoccaceae bacterium]